MLPSVIAPRSAFFPRVLHSRRVVSPSGHASISDPCLRPPAFFIRALFFPKDSYGNNVTSTAAIPTLSATLAFATNGSSALPGGGTVAPVAVLSGSGALSYFNASLGAATLSGSFLVIFSSVSSSSTYTPFASKPPVAVVPGAIAPFSAVFYSMAGTAGAGSGSNVFVGIGSTFYATLYDSYGNAVLAAAYPEAAFLLQVFMLSSGGSFGTVCFQETLWCSLEFSE